MRILAPVLMLLLLAPVYAEPRPTLIWTYDAGWTVEGVDVSSNGGYVALGSGKYVHLLNRSGDLLWKASHDSKVLSVAVSLDGEVVAGDEGNIHFYNKSGDEIWSKYIGDDIEDIALYRDRIAVGSKTRKLYLFDKNGNIIWTYDLNYTVRGVAISKDYVAAGTSFGGVYLFNMIGDMLWKYNGGRFIGDVALQEKTVIAGMNYLYFVKDGKLIDYYITIGEIFGVDATDTFIVASTDKGVVYFVDKANRHSSSYNVTAPLKVALTSDSGHIAVASMEKVLFLTAPDLISPVVRITSPRDGSVVTGMVKIAADINEPSKVRVTIDRNYACGELPCNWDTSASYEGIHTITIEGTDVGGNTGQQTIDVFVKKISIQNVTGTIKERKEAIKEGLNRTVATLRPISKPSIAYSTFEKILLALVVLIILVTIVKMRGSGKKYRYKKSWLK